MNSFQRNGTINFTNTFSGETKAICTNSLIEILLHNTKSHYLFLGKYFKKFQNKFSKVSSCIHVKFYQAVSPDLCGYNKEVDKILLNV